jgi:hypothetical protein
MTLAPRRPSATRWALLTLLIATLLGHVCVLPFHAHAATATPHQHGDESDGTDQTAHIGSCEALAPSPIVHPLPVGTTATEWAAVRFEPTTWVVHDPVVAPPPRSTPLFLLHAALLI